MSINFKPAQDQHQFQEGVYYLKKPKKVPISWQNSQLGYTQHLLQQEETYSAQGIQKLPKDFYKLKDETKLKARPKKEKQSRKASGTNERQPANYQQVYLPKQTIGCHSRTQSTSNQDLGIMKAKKQIGTRNNEQITNPESRHEREKNLICTQLNQLSLDFQSKPVDEAEPSCFQYRYSQEDSHFKELLMQKLTVVQISPQQDGSDKEGPGKDTGSDSQSGERKFVFPEELNTLPEFSSGEKEQSSLLAFLTKLGKKKESQEGKSEMLKSKYYEKAQVLLPVNAKALPHPT